MKHLTLIRHAKSSWDHPALSDHDRPLAPRGLAAAPAIGEALAARFAASPGRPAPDCFVTSSACRARETARLILPLLGADPGEDLLEDSELYGASESEIIACATGRDESCEHAVLFGHNPGFHWVCSTIDPRFQVAKYPTCAVASFDLDIDHWGSLHPGAGKNVFFLRPSDLLD